MGVFTLEGLLLMVGVSAGWVASGLYLLPQRPLHMSLLHMLGKPGREEPANKWEKGGGDFL